MLAGRLVFSRSGFPKKSLAILFGQFFGEMFRIVMPHDFFVPEFYRGQRPAVFFQGWAIPTFPYLPALYGMVGKSSKNAAYGFMVTSDKVLLEPFSPPPCQAVYVVVKSTIITGVIFANPTRPCKCRCIYIIFR